MSKRGAEGVQGLIRRVLLVAGTATLALFVLPACSTTTDVEEPGQAAAPPQPGVSSEAEHESEPTATSSASTVPVSPPGRDVAAEGPNATGHAPRDEPATDPAPYAEQFEWTAANGRSLDGPTEPDSVYSGQGRVTLRPGDAPDVWLLVIDADDIITTHHLRVDAGHVTEVARWVDVRLDADTTAPTERCHWSQALTVFDPQSPEWSEQSSCIDETTGHSHEVEHTGMAQQTSLSTGNGSLEVVVVDLNVQARSSDPVYSESESDLQLTYGLDSPGLRLLGVTDRTNATGTDYYSSDPNPETAGSEDERQRPVWYANSMSWTTAALG